MEPKQYNTKELLKRFVPYFGKYKGILVTEYPEKGKHFCQAFSQYPQITVLFQGKQHLCVFMVCACHIDVLSLFPVLLPPVYRFVRQSPVYLVCARCMISPNNGSLPG